MAALRKCSWAVLVLTNLAVFATATDENLLFNPLKSKDLNDFVSPPFVRVVYFFKGELPLQQPDRFLLNFKQASDILEDYGVKTATLHCKNEAMNEYCSRKHSVAESVFIFRGGNLLLEIQLASMFNIDAIVSNILQMVMLGEVPIVSDEEKLQQIMDMNKGKQDVLYSYQRAVGTLEHRVFMEVAFVYSNQYAFALSTSTEVARLISSTDVRHPTIWYLQCKSVSPMDASTKSCPVLRYTGPINLETFSKYMKLISMPNVLDFQESMLTKSEFDDLQVHRAYIFTDAASYKSTQALTAELGSHFIGSMVFLIVNVNKLPTYVVKQLGYGSQVTEVPSAAFRSYGSNNLEYMSVKFTETNIRNFLKHVLDTFNEETMDERLYTDNHPIFEVPPQEIQDDPVAEDAYLIRNKKFNTTSIPALTDKTFPAMLSEKNLFLVMFYVQWDPRTQVFMEHYAEAGRMLEHMTSDNTSPLARVNCADWPDVCEKNDVIRYPTFILFKNHKRMSEYQDRLDTMTVVKFVSLHLQQNPVTLTTKAEVTQFLEGGMASTGMYVLVLGLFKEKDTEELKAFATVASDLRHRFMFGIMKGGSLAEGTAQYFGTGLSSVVIIKEQDKDEGFTVLKDDLTQGNIAKFIEESSLPVFPALEPENFVALRSLKKPFVILFFSVDNSKVEVRKVMTEMAKSRQFNDFVLCYMEVGMNSNSMGSFILHSYIDEPSLPTIVTVNHDNGKLYNYPMGNDFSKQSISKWLQGISSGKAGLQTGELKDGKWKPLLPAYDFLAMIDSEEAEYRKEVEESMGGGRIPSRSGGTAPKPIPMPTSEPGTPPQPSIHTEL
ncbi:thioredoxin domain-containing protein 16-like [Saccoglossus kowalevskii]|uniref:Thioredoxin domain-containing protein 16-like n=1 Tax=Saccoglossus kowalevskii TaxID=10224 RepID=A0ABM0MX70_SACKO|nr:PREDICTED: thioredoxin domain-containing protein 16-like [Saccoglossus kowalevskii]